MRRLVFLGALWLTLPASVPAQQPYRPAAVTEADYARAERKLAATMAPLLYGGAVTQDDWAEKWQGLLIETSDSTTNYDNQANQLVAGNLKGKLLLAHGTLDGNVRPAVRQVRYPARPTPAGTVLALSPLEWRRHRRPVTERNWNGRAC